MKIAPVCANLWCTNIQNYWTCCWISIYWFSFFQQSSKHSQVCLGKPLSFMFITTLLMPQVLRKSHIPWIDFAEIWYIGVLYTQRLRPAPSSKTSFALLIYSVEKKKRKCFVISSTELGWVWWNLVHRFLNKFVTKSCKRFPPHLNNVSTLSCETSLWLPNSSDLNPVDYSV